jgi:hypothetical protein
MMFGRTDAHKQSTIQTERGSLVAEAGDGGWGQRGVEPDSPLKGR